MKLITDINGNVEMLPKTLMIGITIAILWVLTLVIPPVFQIIPSMATILDTSGSLYYDVETTFNTAVKMWYFFLILITAVDFVHLVLLGIKKQRYTGGNDESDF